jgi:hypothetical protein
MVDDMGGRMGGCMDGYGCYGWCMDVGCMDVWRYDV